MISVLRWIVEVGRTDILMMYSHLALPCKGHLENVYHIFTYLKKHHKSEMVFYPGEVNVEQSRF